MLLLRIEAGMPDLLTIGMINISAAVARYVVNRSLRRAVKQLVALCRKGSCKRMLVACEQNIKSAVLNGLSQPGVTVIVLTLGHDGVNRKMICAELPCFVAFLQIVKRPGCNLFGGVDAHNQKMSVAVVERIIFGCVALGAVHGIGRLKLKIEKISVFKIKFSNRLGKI